MKSASIKSSHQSPVTSHQCGWITVVAFCLFTLTLAGCAGQSISAPVNPVDVVDESAQRAQLFVGTLWKIAKVGDKANFADGVATLSLSREGQLSAFAGCNGMGASFEYADGVLKVGPVMATRMACKPFEKMHAETALGKALSFQSLKVVETPKGATLTNDAGTVIELVPVAQ